MPKRCLGDYISWLEDSSEVSEIKTQEKTQKLKEKTQNSRKNSKLKGKTQFSGISEANKVSQSALKKAWLRCDSNHIWNMRHKWNFDPSFAWETLYFFTLRKIWLLKTFWRILTNTSLVVADEMPIIVLFRYQFPQRRVPRGGDITTMTTNKAK